MLRTILGSAALLVAASVASAPSVAKTIMIANDDGLTSNVKALYEALKAQGHDVIISVPCRNQSGMGAAVYFMKPLGPLATVCRNRAAKAGDLGAGAMTREGYGSDFFYVDGTNVMATLYGLDVAAMKRWGKAPDLVLSGPNEGARWLPSRVGSYQYRLPAFVEDGDVPAGPPIKFAPGTFTSIRVEPTRRDPTKDEADNETVLNRQAITVSVMQVGYDLPTLARRNVHSHLARLFFEKPVPANSSAGAQ